MASIIGRKEFKVRIDESLPELDVEEKRGIRK